MNRKYYLDSGKMGTYFVRNGLILVEIFFFERTAVLVNGSMETHNSIDLALKVSLRLCKFCKFRNRQLMTDGHAWQRQSPPSRWLCRPVWWSGVLSHYALKHSVMTDELIATDVQTTLSMS